MFHSQSLVSRNGPLRNIWMAAYYFRKLKKQQIADTDITFSVDKLLLEVQITYRMLAQLLLGIVRIFSKKVDYLYHDCNKALTNITISFNRTQHTVHKKSTSRSQNAQKKANGGPEDKAVVAKQVVSVSKNGFSTMQMEMIHSACNNVTVTLSDCSQNSQKKGYGGPQDNAAVAKEVVSISKSGIPTMQMEMLRSHHNVTITLPDCFELDAFDLEVEDGGSADISNKKTVHEDVWTSEKDQYSNSFLIEEHNLEDIYDEHNFSCFSPMEDVIPCNIMDLEIIKSYSSESIEAKRMIVEGLQYPEEPENNGHCLHDEHAAENINLVKLRDRMSSDIERELQIGEQKNEVEPTNSYETKPSHSEEFHDVAERNSDARTSGGARDKSNITLDPGLPSPKFAVVTPKTRKEHRLFRKRKILFDDKIVLSNETMGTWIHDASDLVYKRRKAPHTSLDVWKAYQISNLHQSFMMEPLFPYISLEHKANLHDNSSAYLLHKRDTSLFIGNVDVRCETSSEVRLKESSPPPAIFSEISTPDRSEVRMKEMSPIEIPASDVDMMDLDVEFFEKEISDQADTGWSVKTRAVAKYLLERFLSCRDQRREEILNLAQVLRGQSRAKSAKFFYDTLTLTTHQCISVKQDFPYSDIILSPTPLLWGYAAIS